jgi:hypothetical protein
MASLESLHSQSTNDTNKGKFVCPSCKNDEFYEDEHGSFICTICQMQSQDYIPESFDVDEGMVSTFMTRKGPSNRAALKQAKLRIEENKKKIINDNMHEDLPGFLILYQYLLRLILRKITILANIESNVGDILLSKLQELWFGYLTAWNESNVTMITSAMKGDYHNRGHGSLYSNHPLHPSKPLLLGFIYLVCRIERLSLIQADIKRWIIRGDIPYVHIWQSLPEVLLKKHIGSGKLVILFGFSRSNIKADAVQFNTSIPSTTNILFHCISLAKTNGIGIIDNDDDDDDDDKNITSKEKNNDNNNDIIKKNKINYWNDRDKEIIIPYLNTPLIANNIIINMKFPLEVWQNYVSISLLFSSNGDPIKGLESFGMHYPEHVMAAIVLACKMCDDWTKWSVLSNDRNCGCSNNSSINNINSQESNISINSAFSPPRTQRDPINNNTYTNANNKDLGYLTIMPVTINELDNVPRNQLNAFLNRISMTAPIKINQYNKKIDKTKDLKSIKKQKLLNSLINRRNYNDVLDNILTNFDESSNNNNQSNMGNNSNNNNNNSHYSYNGSQYYYNSQSGCSKSQQDNSNKRKQNITKNRNYNLFGSRRLDESESDSSDTENNNNYYNSQYNNNQTSSTSNSNTNNNKEINWLISESNFIKRNETIIDGNLMVRDPLYNSDYFDKNYIKLLFGRKDTYSTESPFLTTKRAYITHTRFENDTSGMYHMQYVSLIERCARYMYTSPGIYNNYIYLCIYFNLSYLFYRFNSFIIN